MSEIMNYKLCGKKLSPNKINPTQYYWRRPLLLLHDEARWGKINIQAEIINNNRVQYIKGLKAKSNYMIHIISIQTCRFAVR